MSISLQSRAGMCERFLSFKYNNVQKRDSRFSLGLHAPKNTHYMRKCLKLKLFSIEFHTKKVSVVAHVYLPPEWNWGLCTEFSVQQLLVFVHYYISKVGIFRAPSSTLRGIDGCPRRLFCTKFDSEQLLFQSFFDVMRIFGSVEPETKSTFNKFYKFWFVQFIKIVSWGQFLKKI